MDFTDRLETLKVANDRLFNSNIVDKINQNIVFNNTDSSISKVSSDVPKVNNGDIRIDMPILCGNIKSQRKVLFLGLVKQKIFLKINGKLQINTNLLTI